jgi:uncharacterized membrane protein
VRPRYLLEGFPGHPLHPPLTDATIGTYTLATILAVLDVAGLVDDNAARGWWLGLVIGLVVSVFTALTGLVDWLKITRWTPLWRTATAHMIAMLAATVCFGLAALVGHGGYLEGDVTTGAFVVTIAGFALLTLGGWLGGTIVFVYGMRVLGLPQEPAMRAITPGHAEREEAAS